MSTVSIEELSETYSSIAPEVEVQERSRPRILLLAFMCSPNHGSEWAVGWNRALECVKHFDTWVICQGDQQAVEIRKFLETHGPIPGLHFEFISYNDGVGYPSHPTRSSWLTYNLWHRKAFRVAQQLHEKLHFDLTHQATNTGFREPGYLWKLNLPFIWGPVGGLHCYPWRFLPEAGLKCAVAEVIRSVLNHIQLKWSVRGRLASRRASALFASNSTAADVLGRARGVVARQLLETGISRVADSTRERGGTVPLRILWSGQLIARKALSLLLKALAKLPQDAPFELRVLGNGPLEAKCKRLAEKLGVADRVEWLGWLPYSQITQQYDWADVFVFTSLRDNSGNVVLEALANGVPIICLDHQGVRDIVTDQCGLKVPVTAPRQVVNDLRDALVHLVRNPKMHAAMSRGALERAREYLWPHLGAQMNDVYRKVLVNQKNRTNGRAMHVAHEEHVNGSKRPHETKLLSNESTTPSAPLCDSGTTTFPRSRIRDTMTWAALRTAAGLNAAFGNRPNATFGILMYHRVADRVPGVSSPTINVTPHRLRTQLSGLLSRGFEAWSLQKLLAAASASSPIPPNVFAVTFDDGFENNLLAALPILEELRVPATIFLSTAFIDSDRPFPFDNWTSAGSSRVPASSWRPLSTAQCRELMASELIELGAHTHTHGYFAGRADAFRRDLSISVEVLAERFGITNPTFSFPFGITSPELVEAAKQAGVSCALTTRSTCIGAGANPYDWGRFSADDRDTVATLAAKLNGWYTPVADSLRPIRGVLGAMAPKTMGEAVTLAKPCFVSGTDRS